MAVYLITAHAYRSWSEDRPQGYVQRDEGLQQPNEPLAKWRSEHASGEPRRFGDDDQDILLDVVERSAGESGVRLHAWSTTPTHVHALISFAEPACACIADDRCSPHCPAYGRADRTLTRMKRQMGLALAVHHNVAGQRWFSRGGDVTPIRDRPHFDHHVNKYLPDHALRQGGRFRKER